MNWSSVAGHLDNERYGNSEEHELTFVHPNFHTERLSSLLHHLARYRVENSGKDNAGNSYVTDFDFLVEDDSELAFDILMEEFSSLFSVEKQCRGHMMACRVGQELKNGLRIDRILVPRPEIIEQKWNLGCIGIEIKPSGQKLGPIIAQVLDYRSSIFTLQSGLRVGLEQICVWPSNPHGGEAASLMAQNRIGAMSWLWNPPWQEEWDGRVKEWGIAFSIGQERLLRLNSGSSNVSLGLAFKQRPGYKSGSR